MVGAVVCVLVLRVRTPLFWCNSQNSEWRGIQCSCCCPVVVSHQQLAAAALCFVTAFTNDMGYSIRTGRDLWRSKIVGEEHACKLDGKIWGARSRNFFTAWEAGSVTVPRQQQGKHFYNDKHVLPEAHGNAGDNYCTVRSLL